MPDRSVARRALPFVALSMALLILAVPVLAAKPDKGPELAKTLTGTVTSSEDAKGRPVFSMTVGGVTWELSAGPRWFWGANNPLAALVGSSVEVAGTYHEGDTELDVDTVDGVALRAPGKPPWSGGPKVVGSSHPGWKDGKPGKGLGRAHAPGQNKDKSKGGTAD
jgi:hypothetical protein